jgi:hypothetical protein
MEMNRFITALIIVLAALLLFAGLIWAKLYVTRKQQEKLKEAAKTHIASIPRLEQAIRGDSLYDVRDVQFKDSAILIAVSNPDKSGTESYFDKKYAINSYGNINMVYIYGYDSAKFLQNAAFDDALMAKGKKMGKFQEEWVSKYIDSTDGSCRPLKKFLRDQMPNPQSFKNQETTYQPENIHSMHVVCKYRSLDKSGAPALNVVTATIGSNGSVLSADIEP